MPAVLLAITMVFQAMEYYWARQAAETAARQAVDAARILGANDLDGARRATDVLQQLGSPLERASVTVVARNGDVVATITGRPHQLVPGMPLTVTAVAQGPIDQFRPPPP